MAWDEYLTLPNYDIWEGRVDNNNRERIHQYINCIDVADLQAKKIQKGIGLIGFACDEGVKRNQGRIGANAGPDAIRTQLKNLSYHNAVLEGLWDFGNINCPDQDLETAQKRLGQLIAKVRAHNILPIVLGGGHETAWGHYLGFKDSIADKKLSIVNFDAHFDLRELVNGELGSSGTPFLQIANYCQENNRSFDYNCIGIQPAANTQELNTKATKLDVKYLLAEEIHLNGINAASELVETKIATADALYVSICLDVFAASVAPGVSSTQPLGLQPWQVIPLLRQLLKSGKVIAIDIVELAPNRDQDSKTAKLAANLVLEIIQQLAQFR